MDVNNNVSFLDGKIGDFTIVRYLGEGGEGAALLIEDKQGSQLVAKVFPLPLFIADMDTETKKPLNEADILTKLDHPHLPKHHEIIDFPDQGRFVTIRDFVEGPSLEEILENEKTLPEPKAIDIMEKVLGILGYLHDPAQHPDIPRPVIHKDIKPANLIVRDDGVIPIDFGVAQDKSNTYATMTSKGTPKYMPIEQILGQGFPSSDIYALGVTIIESLLGEIPETLEENFHFHEPYELPNTEEISPPLRAILNKMVHPDYDLRYQSASDVLDDLKRMHSLQPRNSWVSQLVRMTPLNWAIRPFYNRGLARIMTVDPNVVDINKLAKRIQVLGYLLGDDTHLPIIDNARTRYRNAKKARAEKKISGSLEFAMEYAKSCKLDGMNKALQIAMSTARKESIDIDQQRIEGIKDVYISNRHGTALGYFKSQLTSPHEFSADTRDEILFQAELICDNNDLDFDKELKAWVRRNYFDKPAEKKLSTLLNTYESRASQGLEPSTLLEEEIVRTVKPISLAVNSTWPEDKAREIVTTAREMFASRLEEEITELPWITPLFDFDQTQKYIDDLKRKAAIEGIEINKEQVVSIYQRAVEFHLGVANESAKKRNVDSLSAALEKAKEISKEVALPIEQLRISDIYETYVNSCKEKAVEYAQDLRRDEMINFLRNAQAITAVFDLDLASQEDTKIYQIYIDGVMQKARETAQSCDNEGMEKLLLQAEAAKFGVVIERESYQLVYETLATSQQAEAIKQIEKMFAKAERLVNQIKQEQVDKQVEEIRAYAEQEGLQISAERIANLNATMKYRRKEVVGNFVRENRYGHHKIIAVHSSTNRDYYTEAVSGRTTLFYSTDPMKIGEVSRISDFAGEYFVPSSLAMKLYELITNKTDPKEIVKRLELNRVFEEAVARRNSYLH